MLRFGVHVPVLVEEHVAVRRRGSGFAVVQGQRLARRRIVDQHESAAAEARTDRVGHRDGELHRDRRIDCVATAAQDLGAGLRGLTLGSGNRPALERRLLLCGRRAGKLQSQQQREPNGGGTRHGTRSPRLVAASQGGPSYTRHRGLSALGRIDYAPTVAG